MYCLDCRCYLTYIAPQQLFGNGETVDWWWMHLWLRRKMFVEQCLGKRMVIVDEYQRLKRIIILELDIRVCSLHLSEKEITILFLLTMISKRFGSERFPYRNNVCVSYSSPVFDRRHCNFVCQPVPWHANTELETRPIVHQVYRYSTIYNAPSIRLRQYTRPSTVQTLL